MRMAPEKIPAEPRPAMALPTIRASEVGAMPQMKEPSSKMKRAIRYVHLMEKKVYSLPKVSWKAQVVSR